MTSESENQELLSHVKSLAASSRIPVSMREDMVQDVFMILTRKYSNTLMHDKKRVAERIIHYRVLEHLKKCYRNQGSGADYILLKHSTEAHSPEDSLLAKEVHDSLIRALAQELSLTERTALHYRFYSGHTLAEIARIMGISTSSVQRYVKSSLSKLSRAMSLFRDTPPSVIRNVDNYGSIADDLD